MSETRNAPHEQLNQEQENNEVPSIPSLIRTLSFIYSVDDKWTSDDPSDMPRRGISNEIVAKHKTAINNAVGRIAEDDEQEEEVKHLRL